jgi:hypothetical protein
MLNVIVPVLTLSEIDRFFEKNQSNDCFVFVAPKETPIEALNAYRSKFNCPIFQQTRIGIYNAINTGIGLIESDVYLVMGSDDVVELNNVLEAENILGNKEGIVTGLVDIIHKRHAPKRSLVLHQHKALVSEHSVGTIISKSLHATLGLYDEDYKIAGDAHFLLRAHFAGVKFHSTRLCFGNYSGKGISSRRYYLGQIELARASVSASSVHGLLFSIFIFLRAIKNAMRYIRR